MVNVIKLMPLKTRKSNYCKEKSPNHTTVAFLGILQVLKNYTCKTLIVYYCADTRIFTKRLLFNAG